ncbi:uncharacterized protein STEHIDRAFT_173167 [Stereum hirsutum FP-91666 SS1]|uniref:Uncharacterized protein n=1 Tax=Stereum hirsutum (strain FP-91666) TaxID=721885 RepID=R7RWT5_STEHR|nr:uncharacterized protein STEHIDRAFT_173167 [Stereum hirsutum FP-91666 SS1]EIM79295.1 hypothetical protein STEHIDRAFT_173167 [Stereum hirsutum FP-91666 SS1]
MSEATPFYPGDAAIRLRDNMVATFALVTFTFLLPVPSIPRTLWILLHPRDNSWWDLLLALINAGFLTVFLLNIGYATYFIRFPRKSPPRPAPAPSPIPPPPAPAPGSPAASILRSSTGTAPRSGSKLGLSPNTTPQRQLPFSSSISSSIAASDPYNLAKSYSLGFSDPNLSFATSTPSPTPSPLAAYKGRRGVGVARPLDGSLLARLTKASEDTDSEDEDGPASLLTRSHK